MPLDAALCAKILASVEDGFADQIAYTRDLVRFASLRGAEHGIQDFIHAAMASRGYAMERFLMDRAAIAAHPGGGRFSPAHSDAPIVVGTHRPRDQKGRSLILQGHVDVVPTGPVDMWSRDPFDPHIDGDWLYGRGAGDMKAGDAAMLFCLDALRRIGYQPAATVYIQSVVEEESTGNGALMTHLHGYKADAAFLPEPGHERVTRANVGVIWFQVEVRGVPVHVSEMGTGLNAIDSAYRIVPALRELETAWNTRKSAYPAFAGLAHPINLNIGKIEGGDWASSVPCWCRIDCRISLFPGQSASEAADEIRATIDAFAASDPFLQSNPPMLTFNGFFAEGYVLTSGSEAEATLGRAHYAAVSVPLQTTTATAYLDARVYALYDKIPALNYGPIAENIHGVDERVSLASVKRITGTMALFVAEWCGLEAV